MMSCDSYDQSLKQSTETLINKSYYFDWSGGFAIIHQPASSHSFKGSLTKPYSEVRCGRYALLRLLYHVTTCAWSYSSKTCNSFAFILQHAVTCKYQVCNTSSPTHILALNSCHLFQRNLTFQGVERKVPPAASRAWLIERRIIQSQ